MPLNPTLLETNPNDITGGSGSLAGPTGDQDATGPYFVWPNQEYESFLSPAAVVAASEVRLMAKMLDEYEAGQLDALSGGESADVQPDVPETPRAVKPPESPEFEITDGASAEAFILAFTQE